MSRSKWILFVMLGVVFASGLIGRVLASYEWNPSTTVKFGEAFPEHNAYAERLLGPLILSPQAGHDGKFFFSQAMDPFYIEPHIHAIYLDRPTYRAQRMLYPTLASLGGALGAEATAWGLIIWNVLFVGAGTAITARLAVELGLSPWFGLAFTLNPGMLIELTIDGAGILALAALMAAVLAAVQDKVILSSVALTVAALTRETMLLGAVGLGIYWLWQKRTIHPSLAAPFVAVTGWWLYVHWRLSDGLAQDTQALGVPLQGFIEAFQGWLSTPGSTLDLLIGTILMFAASALAVRAIMTPTLLGMAVAPFALLGWLLSEPVWERYFDSSRALAPILTAYVLLIVAHSKGTPLNSERLVRSRGGERADRDRGGHSVAEARG